MGRMTIQIDFTKDVAARCVEKLTEAGYTPQPTDDEDAIRTYISIRHRRVRPKPRVVHKATYTVPAHLAAGEQQLLSKVAAGDDLWPYQSRKIEKAGVEDGMLNDYGIQHFHLGIGADPKRPSLIQGTKELLFAVVREDTFYAIGIYDHTAWSKKALLDVVNSTWPALLEPYTLKYSQHMKVLGLRHNYTDEETAKLRAAGINVLQQRPDGKVQMGMGGGVATDGSSIAVRRETDRLVEHIEILQKQVTMELEKLVADGVLPPDAPVHVVWTEDRIFAVPEPAAVKVNLTGRLVIPAL